MSTSERPSLRLLLLPALPVGLRFCDFAVGASLQVGAGAGLLLLALLLALRATGIWFSDAIVWPLVLVGAGTALLNVGVRVHFLIGLKH